MNRLLLLLLLGAGIAAPQESLKYFVTYGLITEHGVIVPVSQVRMYNSHEDAMDAQRFLANQPDKFHMVDLYSASLNCMAEAITVPATPHMQKLGAGSSITMPATPQMRKLPEPRPAEDRPIKKTHKGVDKFSPLG